MKSVNTVQKVTARGYNLFNLVRSMAGNDFKDRVPVATQDNIKEIGSYLFSHEMRINDFSNILVNQVGKIWITYLMFKNPLAILKKGQLEYGDTVEDLYLGLPKAHSFEDGAEDGAVFAREIPESLMAFYRRNYRVFYKVSISEDQWRAAFTSWGELDRFVASVFQSMYSAAQNDEYLTMLNIINRYGTDGLLPSITVSEVTDKETAENLLVAIKATANKFVFPSTEFNGVGVPSNVNNPSSLVLIVTADADAYMDVKALAAAFNVEFSKISYRKIVIPSFGDAENEDMKKVCAILCDERFFQVYDCLERFKNIENPEKLYTNWFAHYWRIMFACPWANAVAFTTVKPVVSSVTVSPSAGAQAKGSTIQCSAKVDGTGVFSKRVAWAVSGNSDDTTTINANTGVLTIGKNETGPITVMATSVYDSGKSGSAQYTIS